MAGQLICLLLDAFASYRQSLSDGQRLESIMTSLVGETLMMTDSK